MNTAWEPLPSFLQAYAGVSDLKHMYYIYLEKHFDFEGACTLFDVDLEHSSSIHSLFLTFLIIKYVLLIIVECFTYLLSKVKKEHLLSHYAVK